MANDKPDQKGLKPGEHIKHGFYIDTFMPCNKCEKVETCPNKNKFKDHRGDYRCIEEKEFFEKTIKDIQENFQLDAKDTFQLPQMVMTMIKLKRMARFTADHGETGRTLLFNPKTGAEHQFNTPAVLNRDQYYSQKALLAYFDSLKLSRSARDAKEGIDVFMKLALGGKPPSKSR